ncbi:hypothetical protein BC834DRAFT_974678 [Gloeopeniophorella convolvens]|nr:hypothetical protein BC834DRAFT_974678 [Gloeopeniophorella convolvens]
MPGAGAAEHPLSGSKPRKEGKQQALAVVNLLEAGPQAVTRSEQNKHRLCATTYADIIVLSPEDKTSVLADGALSPPQAIEFRLGAPVQGQQEQSGRVVAKYESGAPGFLDSQQVIRKVRPIPAFALGRTLERLEEPFVRRPEDEGQDWEGYNLNIFVNRDAMMY